MDIFDKVKQNQNKDEMLKRSLERLIQLYTDKAHFVYELLQNAEDAGATKIKFFQFADRLEVVHNGVPFSESNLQGICDIGKSDKQLNNNLNKIGEFGVGFKSVFGICEKVYLVSHPKEEDLKNGFERFSGVITDFTNINPSDDIDFDDEYTTKFVFPYATSLSFSAFKSADVLNKTLSERLQNLGITTLLFMKNLESIDYEINLPDFDLKKSGSYRLQKTQINDWCCLVSALGHTDSKNPEEIEIKKEEKSKAILRKKNKNEQKSYLVFSRDIKNLPGKTLDIAFTVLINEENEKGKYKFVQAKNPYISVYFPTETESKLDFIVQGPFRTTPNRSSVPNDNEENIDLAEQTAIFLKDIILELRDSGDLNLSFLNILPVNKDVFSSAPLFEKMFFDVADLMKKEKVLLCKDGTYEKADSVKLARGAELTEVFTDDLLSELINSGKECHWLPTELTETNTKYDDLYRFLTGVLKIQVFRPENLKYFIENNKNFLPNRSNEWLEKFYNYCATVSAIFDKQRTDSENMLTVEFVKTSNGKFAAPFRKIITQNEKEESSSSGNKNKQSVSWQPNVFLPSKSLSDVPDMNFVDNEIFKKCESFFKNTLKLQNPNDYDYFIKDFKARHENSSSHFEENETFFKMHIQDIENLLFFVKKRDYESEIRELIKEYLTLRCNKNGKIVYLNPQKEKICFAIVNPNTESEMNIEMYFKNIVCLAYVDSEFYKNRQISFADLKSLGVQDSVAVGTDKINGDYEESLNNRGRKPVWHTEGDFRRMLSLEHLEIVLNYIKNNPNASDSKEKSKFIFRFLRENEKKLVGKLYLSGKNEDIDPAYAEIINIIIGFKRAGINFVKKWLFTKNGELVSSNEISKYDLDTDLYGKFPSQNLCELLEFKKNDEEQRKEVAKKIADLSEEEKHLYFEETALQILGKNVSRDEIKAKIKELLSGKSKNGNVIQTYPQDSSEFPKANVKNWSSLKKHAAQELLWANPVTYEKTWRRVRTSKDYSGTREYLKNMYTFYNSDVCACQMCHKPSFDFSACQIKNNPELELDAMNLCFCPTCEREYKRNRNNENLIEDFLRKIHYLSDDEIKRNETVKIDFGGKSIWFTQTHAAEIRELLRLQSEK